MSGLTLVVAGLAMGLAIAAPLGPVNIMVVREALQRGPLSALVTGLGAVAADTLFAGFAAFGLQSVAQFLQGHALVLSVVGGVLLVAIGIGTAKSRVTLAALEASRGQRPGFAHPLAAFAATLTNPGALLGVFAVFGGLGPVLHLAEGPARPLLVTAAFALGGIAWWTVLGLAVSRLRGRLNDRWLNRLNRWTGVAIAAFGFAILLSLFD